VSRILKTRAGNGAKATGAEVRNIYLIEPVPYLSFVALMERASLILTDSGGIQEEALSLGKPVLVMRETTERPEALATGLVKLVGTDQERIVSEATRLLEARIGSVNSVGATADLPGRHPNPYGDGKAAQRVAAACAEYLAGCSAQR
jgi:UDP-N-acetylglucosamine 2-epimerase (non-hydrolysing)